MGVPVGGSAPQIQARVSLYFKRLDSLEMVNADPPGTTIGML